MITLVEEPKIDVFLTEAQAREILGLCRQSCYNLRKAGILTSIYENGKVMYSANEVEALILDRSTPKALPVAKRKVISVTPNNTVRKRATPKEPKKCVPSHEGYTPYIPPTAPQKVTYEDFDNFFI